jgi:molybdopterin synthase sulfur carrier subunit
VAVFKFNRPKYACAYTILSGVGTEWNKFRPENNNNSGRTQMKVEVKFFTSLREITGKKVDEVQLQDIITVEELLTQLSKKYGKEFREYLYNEKGKVHSYLSILVNGKSTNVLQGLNTELKEGDTIAILPPVGGG